MQTILVPTDFSAYANNAIRYATAIARREKAKIILLHAFNITYVSPDMPMEYYTQELFNEGQRSLDRLNKLSEESKRQRIPCEVINKRGTAVETIIDTTKKRKIDLVIMGTKGASGLKEIFVGSNTADVISDITCPVIAIPKRAHFNGLKKIIYATDYHSSDLIALRKLAELAKIFRSKITVVHISDDEYTPEHEIEYIERFVKKIQQKVNYRNVSHQLIYGFNIEHELEHCLRKNHADMLSISTKYRNLFERIFGSSITKKLAYHTKVPLMVFHYKQESVVLI